MTYRQIPLFTQVQDCTQVEEDALALTLGSGYGMMMVFNTTLGKIRIWNGTAFADMPDIPPTVLTTTNNNASYRTILGVSGSHTAAKVAGTYALGYGDPIAVSGTGTLYPLGLIYLSSTDLPTVNGITTKLRIRAQVHINDVAPTGNYTFGLYPVTRPATSGGAGLNIFTLGTVVAGSNGAVFTAPAADSSGIAIGADFVLPANGFYAVGVVTTATVAASSHVHLLAQLQMRN